MPLMPGIGLDFQPSQALQGFPQQAIQMRQLGQQMAKQQAVRQLSQTPGMMEGGLYTDKGVMALSQIDPAMSSEAVQKRAAVLNLQSEARKRQAEVDKIRDKESQDSIDGFMAEALNSYYTPGGSEEDRKRKMVATINDSVDAMIKDGRAKKYGWTDEQIAKLRSWNSPDDIQLALIKHGKTAEADYLEGRRVDQKLREKAAADGLAKDAASGGVPLSDATKVDPNTGALVRPMDQPKIETNALGTEDPLPPGVSVTGQSTIPKGGDVAVVAPAVTNEKEKPEREMTMADFQAKAEAKEKEAADLRQIGGKVANKRADEAQKEANNYWTKSQNADRIEQAQQRLELARSKIDMSKAGAAYDPKAVTTMAWEKLMWGTDPKGMGPAGNQIRADVQNARARLGEQLGLTPQEMSMMPHDNKVKMKAVDKMTTWGAFVDKSADQLNQSLDLAIKYAEQLGPGRIRLLNEAIIKGKTEFNDPIANAYAVQVNTVRTEYERLMTGPTSNAMLPVEAMKKGAELIGRAMDVPSWQEVGKAIRNDAKITHTAIENQIGMLRSSMVPGGEKFEGKPAELEPIATYPTHDMKARPAKGGARPEVKSSPGIKSPPKVGDIYKGHRFKGGDPGKQENWEAVSE